MALTPYCGRCHQWMIEMFHDVWVCDCTPGGMPPDTTKDPNCHNPGHDHHDPLSPIVLGNNTGSILLLEEVEEEVIDELDEILKETNQQVDTQNVCTNCQHDEHYYANHREPNNPCGAVGCLCTRYLPLREAKDLMSEMLGEEEPECWCRLDEETGLRYDIVCPRHDGEFEVEVPENACLHSGHNWVRVGEVKKEYEPEDKLRTFIDWGPVQCLRCGEPAPVGKCLVHSYSVGAPFCDRCGQPMDEAQVWPEKGFVAREGPTDRPGGEFEESVGGPHKCPGCNLRDLTMEDAKDHIGLLLGVIGLVGILQPGLPKQLAGKSVQDIRREAAAFLRMSENKIRAMKGEGDDR